ncbi:MAG: hypothetical protein IJO71_18420 [Microbacterium sp.]|uniref:hypothetical protein n=1 Tax=Microbacterium sp. TaxID=51671 RepID=UPI0025FB809A|nr:hypothetical protein [Microbacterium sp.]MBQ9919160.1 hypothetical protein [Microbacterium sp.]
MVLFVGVWVIAASGSQSSDPGLPILLVGWGVYCLSAINFVWPQRWRRAAEVPVPDSPPPVTPRP